MAVTSASASTMIHATKRILYATIQGFFFEHVTHNRITVMRATLQASSSGICADITVVLEVRQSIGENVLPLLPTTHSSSKGFLNTHGHLPKHHVQAIKYVSGECPLPASNSFSIKGLYTSEVCKQTDHTIHKGIFTHSSCSPLPMF